MRFFKKTIFWLIILSVISGVFYFFDEKVTEKEIAEEEQRRIGRSCRSFKGSMEVLLEDVSRMLSEFTNQASVVLLPALKKNY